MVFMLLFSSSFMPRMDGPVCQNCGLSFDPKEDEDANIATLTYKSLSNKKNFPEKILSID